MRWKFGDFEFDEERKTLSCSDQTLLLEPKTAALLGYFCRHAQQDVSRDTLLEFVWHGQIVTDGAINRVILKLRKALLDDGKIKTYIATVPKIGYRFIAKVSEVTNSSLPGGTEKALTVKQVEPTQSKPKTKSLKSWLLVGSFIALLMMVLVSVSYYQTRESDIIVTKPLISPITRLSEDQFDASLSHNNKLLAYSTRKAGEVAIFVVDPVQQNSYQISRVGGNALNAHWSQDDNEIIYLYHQQDLCQFHRVIFIEGVAQKPEVLYQCSGKSFTEFAYAQAAQKLYFVERETPFSPYIAYELALKQDSKRRLSQPVASGKGNHLLQRHNKSGKILLLSDQKPGKTTAYELDIENNTFVPLLAFDYAIVSAVWNHQTDGLVHPAKHPSYQLLMSYFDQRNTRALVVDSNRISQVRAIDNDKDYLFTSYMSNRDIEINNHIEPSYNSSVMDYLPQLNLDGSILAFISKRTGYSKIWLVNLANNSLRSIEPPDKGRTFYSLQWSFDDRYLLANTDSGIIIYDSQSLTIVSMIDPGLPAYAVGWLANDELVYSLYQDKHWQLYQQNIKTNTRQRHDQRWAFALASPSTRLFIDQAMALYLNDNLVSADLPCAHPVARRALTVQLDGKAIICVAEQDNKTLLKYSEQLGIQTIGSDLTRVRHFSVAGKKITKARLASSRSDIIRTNF